MILLSLFARAFLQVALVALNVRYISRGMYPHAFVTGFCISAFWWANAGAAALLPGIAPLATYAAGAGLGTVVGMYLGRPKG